DIRDPDHRTAHRNDDVLRRGDDPMRDGHDTAGDSHDRGGAEAGGTARVTRCGVGVILRRADAEGPVSSCAAPESTGPSPSLRLRMTPAVLLYSGVLFTTPDVRP